MPQFVDALTVTLSDVHLPVEIAKRQNGISNRGKIMPIPTVVRHIAAHGHLADQRASTTSTKRPVQRPQINLCRGERLRPAASLNVEHPVSATVSRNQIFLFVHAESAEKSAIQDHNIRPI